MEDEYDLIEKEDRKQQISEQNQEYKWEREYLHIFRLEPVTPIEYYNRLLAEKKKEIEEPTKRKARKEAGITLRLQIRAFIPFFFPEEKKEYNEKVNNSLDKLNNEYRKRCNAINNDLIEKHEQLRKQNKDEVEEYFSFLLTKTDSFSLDFDENSTFQIQCQDVMYDPDTKLLQFKYKVPDKGDILVFGDYRYDENNDEAVFSRIDDKDTERDQRIDVLQKVMLRAVLLIYMSDEYQLVENVKFTGFITYYDPSYGNNRQKNVVAFDFSRQDYIQTDFERVDVQCLFHERIKPQISKELYSKATKDIEEIK